MHACKIIAVLLLLANAVLAQPVTLDNGLVRITITPELMGVRPGSLTEFVDYETGLDLADGLQFSGVHTDVFLPSAGQITLISDTEAVFCSPFLYDHTGSDILPVKVSIVYRLQGRGLEMIYTIEATAETEFLHPLEVDFSVRSWETVSFGNQTVPDDRVVNLADEEGLIRISGDQSVILDRQIQSPALTASVLFPNPSKANLVLTDPVNPDARYLTLRFFDVEPPRENCVGPDLHSLLPGGDVSSYFVSFSMDDDFIPVFISGHPDGFERTASWMLDEIPMIHPEQGYIWGFSTTSSGPEPITALLISLLEDHPSMKMNWLILPDAILTPNRDSVWWEPGQISWSHAHCTWRISTQAIPEYIQWLRNIENDVYPWADRVNMGSHGYHHTPNQDSSFGEFHEFITYEPVEHLERFMMFSSDITDAGLDTSQVNRAIRFSGHRTSLSGLWAAIAWGFDFYCNGVRWYEWNGAEQFVDMIITKFQTPSGRIWGTNSVWWADFSVLQEDSLLSTVMERGKHGLLGGHPINMLAGGTVPEAYNRLDSICTSLETDYPHFGWLFPIEYGEFLEETYSVDYTRLSFYEDHLELIFSGQISCGQTMVFLMPDSMAIDCVKVDNQQVSFEQRPQQRVFTVMPDLETGSHSLEAFWTYTGFQGGGQPADPAISVTNPAMETVVVRACGLEPSTAYTIAIYDLCGRLQIRQDGTADGEGAASVSFSLKSWRNERLPAALYLLDFSSGGIHLSRSFVSIRR
jgi:hypothetical protein